MRRAAVSCLLGAALCAPCAAHRLDEYLQATLISLSPDSVTLEVNLTPGVEVFERVAAPIDANHDGELSPAEQSAYAGRILGDVALDVDGHRQALELIGSWFPPLQDMRTGLGTIRLKLRAPAVAESGRHAVLFRNHHQSPASVYLMNALAPPAGFEILEQRRDYLQTEIQINYRLDSGGRGSPWAPRPAWLVAGGLAIAAMLGSLFERRIRSRRLAGG